MRIIEQGAGHSRGMVSATLRSGGGVFASYFMGLLLLALLTSILTAQATWGAALMEFSQIHPTADPAYFASGALDIARHGWITPANQWLIRLWPPGFMVLEGLGVRLVGEKGPFLIPLLAVSAFFCATWMSLLRRYLLRSGMRQRPATLAPLLPFVFPLSSFFLLSPVGLSFGETFAVSLYAMGFVLVLLAFRAESLWKVAALAAPAGFAFAGAAYFRSQFELLVLSLSLGAGAILVITAAFYMVKKKSCVDLRVLLISAVSLVAAHTSMAPWRIHNYIMSGSTNWVATSMLVYENALRPETDLLKAGGTVVVKGGGHLACKLESSFCGQKDGVYFYRSFLNNMGTWIAYKAQLLPEYWMAPPRLEEMWWPGVEATATEKAANLAFLACLFAGLWRLWSIRRDPIFPLQAWLLLSLYGCMAAVYTLVHLETRYFYLPKIFSVVALVALLAPRGQTAVRTLG
jgi:hypothetical protein